jgi:hypothetical protein
LLLLRPVEVRHAEYGRTAPDAAAMAPLVITVRRTPITSIAAPLASVPNGANDKLVARVSHEHVVRLVIGLLLNDVYLPPLILVITGDGRGKSPRLRSKLSRT